VHRLCVIYADIYRWSAVLAIVSGAMLAGSTHIGGFIIFPLVAGASASMVVAAVPVSGNILE